MLQHVNWRVDTKKVDTILLVLWQQRFQWHWFTTSIVFKVYRYSWKMFQNFKNNSWYKIGKWEQSSLQLGITQIRCGSWPPWERYTIPARPTCWWAEVTFNIWQHGSYSANILIPWYVIHLSNFNFSICLQPMLRMKNVYSIFWKPSPQQHPTTVQKKSLSMLLSESR